MEVKKVIDLKATKQKIKEKGWSNMSWARLHGFNELKMLTKMQGKVRFAPEEIEAMKADGVYVELA